MKSYIVTAPKGAALPIGVELKPSADQLSRRTHALQRKGKTDIYVTTQSVTFKFGETVVVAYDAPKSLMALSEPVNSEAGKAVAAQVAARAEKPGLLAQAAQALGFGQAPAPGAPDAAPTTTDSLTPPV